LATAAFIACKLIVINSMNKATNVVITKTVQLMLVRYAKLCSQLFITNQASGEAIITATITSFRKSFDSKATILVTLSPNTFLNPISFIDE